MPRSKNPLTPAQRHERAVIAANARWTRETNRQLATKPGLDAAREKLIDAFDPDRTLSEAQRAKRLKNAQAEQMARLRFLALKAREERAAEANGDAR